MGVRTSKSSQSKIESQLTTVPTVIPTSTVSPTPISITDKSTWTTYTDSGSYKLFSFKYPLSWQIATPTAYLETTRPTNKQATMMYRPGEATIYIVASVLSVNDEITRSENVMKKENVTLDNQPAIRLTGTRANPRGVAYYTKIILSKNDKTATLTLSTQDTDYLPTFTTEFNQMLSTLTFIN